MSELRLHSLQDLWHGDQERGMRRVRQAVRKVHLQEKTIRIFTRSGTMEGEGCDLHPPEVPTFNTWDQWQGEEREQGTSFPCRPPSSGCRL